MNVKKSLFTLILGSFFMMLASLSHAEIFQYTDKEGKEWFVTDFESIPKEYRDQTNKVLEDLPPSKPVKQETTEKKEFNEESDIDKRIKARMLKRKMEKQIDLIEVEVYVTSWCPHCQSLEKFLQTNKIPYKRFDIEKHPGARERFEALGGRGYPLTKIGNVLIQGNDQRRIAEVLKQRVKNKK